MNKIHTVGLSTVSTAPCQRWGMATLAYYSGKGGKYALGCLYFFKPISIFLGGVKPRVQQQCPAPPKKGIMRKITFKYNQAYLHDKHTIDLSPTLA